MSHLKSIILSICLTFFVISESFAKSDVYYIMEKAKTGVVSIVITKKDSATSLGTGFFIGKNLILTNHHVVGNSGTTLNLFALNSSERYDIDVVYDDELTDVSFIKLRDIETFYKNNTPYIFEFAIDSEIYTTQEVYAIGHPWGLLWSVSKGIISSDLRHEVGSVTPDYSIQTDAHVFSGNSGGPLLTSDGSVVGMNSSMIAQNGGSYGFAVPAPILKKLLNDFNKYNEVRWASIGFTIDPTRTIRDLTADKPGIKSGLKINDVIVSIKTNNGTITPKSNDEVIEAIASSYYGVPIDFGILRDGKTITIKIQASYNKSEFYKK
ncbi:MAG: S1C family serine protease [bacterium]